MSCDHPRYGNLASRYARTRGRCHLCGEKLPPSDEFGQIWLHGRDTPTMDHIITQQDNGPDDDWNTLPAHLGCNASRGTGDPDEARLRISGQHSPPMSSGEATAVAAASAVAAAAAVGVACSKTDPETGEVKFNWGAGLAAGLAIAALTRLAID